MAVIAAAILLDDGRPVLFRQERLGHRRRPFHILKFRSMRDGRVTRVGRVLRATGLDELPQFVNILRGDMSAVGPRPLTADDVARLGWSGPRSTSAGRAGPASPAWRSSSAPARMTTRWTSIAFTAARGARRSTAS